MVGIPGDPGHGVSRAAGPGDPPSRIERAIVFDRRIPWLCYPWGKKGKETEERLKLRFTNVVARSRGALRPVEYSDSDILADCAALGPVIIEFLSDIVIQPVMSIAILANTDTKIRVSRFPDFLFTH